MRDLPEYPSIDTMRHTHGYLCQLVRDVSQLELNEKWHKFAKRFLANEPVTTKEAHDLFLYTPVLRPTSEVAKAVHEYLIMIEKIDAAHTCSLYIRDISPIAKANIAREAIRQKQMREEYADES